MKTLKELLVKIFEGHCERKPNETDDEYLQRCSNLGFTQHVDRYDDGQPVKGWSAKWYEESLEPTKIKKDKENGSKHDTLSELDINNPSPKLRPEPHPTRHETEHPPYETDAMKYKGKYTQPTKK